MITIIFYKPVSIFQLQVQLQNGVPQPDLNGTTQSEDDVDAALTDLQMSLEGSSISKPGDITHIPELHDYLRFFKWVKWKFWYYSTEEIAVNF